jgi:disulfide bond formation protein DsbB
MLKKLSRLPKSTLWWTGLIILCLLLESVGLYYQYQLNTLPCVLCIHIRMLLFALLLVSFLALIWPLVRLLMFVVTSGIWFWMAERSYQLLGTELGWVLGECEMSSGLPSWLALESWAPWIFKIHEPCGYTPFLLFRISMAEALIVLSFVFSAICLLALFAMIFKTRKQGW